MAFRRTLSVLMYTALSVGVTELTSTIAMAQSESAQVAQRSSEALGFEEIIVTARKRVENIQIVPIAITAFSSQDLESRNVRSLGDLRFVTPSLSVQPDTFRQDTINITLRGLRNFPSNGIQFDTAAAIYTNGVYISRAQGLTGTLFDVESVQVLKGPQGTLVGRNAAGGAVLYTTREPQEEFGGYVTLTGGEYGRYELQGVINVPLTDKIFARAGYSYAETKGYLRNIFFDPATGERNDTPGLGSRKTAGQFSVKFQPDDTAKIVLRGDFDAEHHTGTSYHLVEVFEGTRSSFGALGTNPTPVSRSSICNIPTTCNLFNDLDGRIVAPYFSDVSTLTVNTDPRAYNTLFASLARQADDFWSIDQANSAYNIGHFQSVSGVADKTFGDINVKLLGGYRWTDTAGSVTSRGAPYNNIQIDYIDPNYAAYTAELTVNGFAFENKLNWTAGAFFFNESVSKQGQTTVLFSTNRIFPQALPGRQARLTDSTGNSGENTSYAGYAQATYNVLPALRLTGGVRYTVDERSARIVRTSTAFPSNAALTASVQNAEFDPTPFIFNGIAYSGSTVSCGLVDDNGDLQTIDECFFDINETFKKPTWTISIDYDVFDDTLVYFTTRKGYKSGAINSQTQSAAVAVAKPETVQDYEIGVKSDWFFGDMPVRSNFAAYLTQYKDIQVQQGLPNVIFATGPNNEQCTQATFNAGSCVGFSTDPVTLNAKSARIYGFEWDVSVKPVPELTLSWNGSYLNTKYTDYSFTPPPGFLQPVSGADLTGQPFPLPAWQMSGSATYAIPGDRLRLPVEEIALTANVYYQGDFRTELEGFNPRQKVKGYALTDLRLNVRNIAGKNVDLSGYLSNVFNKKACLGEPGGTGAGGGAGVLTSTPNFTFGVPNTYGLIQCVPLPPRMFAATLRYNF